MNRIAGLRPKKTVSDELRPEYRFDYSKAKPNRFAAEARKGCVVVVLDEDIARVFRTPESVKAVLRALISTMPGKTAPKARKKPTKP